MSLINEALKQARGSSSRSGNRPGSPGYPVGGAGTSSRSRDVILFGGLFVCFAMVVVLGGVLVYVLLQPRAVATMQPPVTASAVPTPAPPAPPAGQTPAAVDGAAPASAVPEIASAVATPPRTGTPAPDSTAPVAEPVPPPPPAQPAVVAAAVAPSPSQPAFAPEAVRTRYPLKGIMQGTDSPLALIGSNVMRPGQDVDERARVLDIKTDHVILEVEGTPYRLRLP